MMRNIAFLIKESGMGYEEIINLSYAVFLSLLKQFRLFILEQDPEWVKEYNKSKVAYETEPDLGRLRKYTKK